MIKDYVKMAFESFRNRKLRSWLTMIGIFIGITAVIAIISLGQGLEQAITEEFEDLGSDKLWLQPGTGSFTAGSSAAVLTDRDRRAVERVSGVRDTLGMSYQNARVESSDEDAFVLVFGYELTSENVVRDEIYGINILLGRMHESGDTFKAFLGHDYLQENEVFERPLRLFDTLTINGIDFNVIGFLESLGNDVDDRSVFITDDAYEEVFGERLEDDYKFIVIKTAPGEDPNAVADRVERELRDERGLDEGDEDFQIQTTEELMASFGTILTIVQIVILGIAAISLIVGGVGIMNTMYTAVVERTQEIGIMKAVGARNSDILQIFLLESGLLGLAGGAIGIALGLGLAYGVQELGGVMLQTDLVRAWWNWWLILGGLVFAFLTGVLSGVMPAYRASRKQAVDSLRYE